MDSFKPFLLQLGKIYPELHALSPDEFPWPTSTESQVTQWQVNALVGLSKDMQRAKDNNDEEAQARACLHWLVMYEHIRLQNLKKPALLDVCELSVHANHHFGIIRPQDVDDFVKWIKAQHGEGQFDEKNFAPLSSIRRQATENGSTARGSHSFGSSTTSQ